MLQDCKLSYFPLTGRGEACRLALHVKGVPFTDDRVPFPQWGTTKPTTPWMSMPVLTLADGTIAGQQRAILRFIGKQLDLYPKDDLLALRCDEMLDVLDDLQGKINAAGQGKEQAEKESDRKEVRAQSRHTLCVGPRLTSGCTAIAVHHQRTRC
eukprot:3131233-Prymnesium_polylepis.1